MVENNWGLCNSLDYIYSTEASKLIKDTLNIATEDTQCASLKFFADITPGDNRSLIEVCAEVSFCDVVA